MDTKRIGGLPWGLARKDKGTIILSNSKRKGAV
jgi:hypothetical protein